MITHVKYNNVVGSLTTEQVLDLFNNDRIDVQDIVGCIPLGYYRIDINVKRDVPIDLIEEGTEEEIEEIVITEGGLLLEYYDNIADYVYDRLMNLVKGGVGEEWYFSDIADDIIDQATVDFPLEIALSNMPEEEDL